MDVNDAEVRRALVGLGLRFLEEPGRGDLIRALYRLRTAGQMLVIAACAPRWRPVLELALALTQAPDRQVAVTGPGAPTWEDLLQGRANAGEDRPPTTWIARGFDGDQLLPGLDALNFARDRVMRPGMRLWVWLPLDSLGEAPRLAPDLWRARSAALLLRAHLAAEVDLPSPVPAIEWPFPWVRPP